MFHQRAVIKVWIALSVAISVVVYCITEYRFLAHGTFMAVLAAGVILIRLFVTKKEWYRLEDEELGVAMLGLRESSQVLVREHKLLDAGNGSLNIASINNEGESIQCADEGGAGRLVAQK
jgi:hypothetical protein